MMMRQGAASTKIQHSAADRLLDRLTSLHLLHKNATKSRFPEVKDLGLPKDSYLLVISGLTRNVNTGKQIGQAAVIDVNTQKIVWAISWSLRMTLPIF